MTQRRTKNENRLGKLNKFLRQNKDLDWQTVNLLDRQKIEGLNWKGLEKDQDAVLKEVKAYQRLVRVLGQDNPTLIKALLKENIHSAVQIAAIPKQQFIKQYAPTFKKDHALMENTYKKAVALRSQLLLRYMDRIQRAEPYTGQVRSLGGEVIACPREQETPS